MAVTKVVLDNCISGRMVVALQELYGDRGYKFMALKSIVANPEKNDGDSWADAYKRFNGKIVISGDSRIASRPHQALGFIDNGFICFFPGVTWGRLRGHEKAALMVYWWPYIEEQLKAANDGTCWRIPCSGRKDNIKLVVPELEKLEIPDEVLQETRAKKSA